MVSKSLFSIRSHPPIHTHTYIDSYTYIHILQDVLKWQCDAMAKTSASGLKFLVELQQNCNRAATVSTELQQSKFFRQQSKFFRQTVPLD
jgi:hypothetical protein